MKEINQDNFLQELLDSILNILPELAKVEEIQSNLTPTPYKLEEAYQDIFPKTCGKCKTEYKNRQEYLDGTTTNDAHILSRESYSESDSVLEFRLCGTCKNSLLIVHKSRRNMTDLGTKKRKIFDECIVKLTKRKVAKKKAVTYLRFIFQKIEENQVNRLKKAKLGR